MEPYSAKPEPCNVSVVLVASGTADGVIFDAENILPFLKEHKCSPITAEPMRFRDLVTLHMAKNADGKWHCPVTFKVFNDNSRICCVRTSGHVYAYEAVAELNIKAKNWKDLMTDEPFKRADIIMLQDPIDEALKSRRDIANFSYLKLAHVVLKADEPLPEGTCIFCNNIGNLFLRPELAK